MQKHHCLPLSLRSVHFLPSGKVNEANIVIVTNEEHKLIHDLLNIPYGMIRDFIKTHEWKLQKDVQYFQHVHKMQQVYFARLGFLPPHLQEIHAESIKQQCVTLAEAYGYYGDTYQTAEFTDSVAKLNFYHSIYYQIMVCQIC